MILPHTGCEPTARTRRGRRGAGHAERIRAALASPSAISARAAARPASRPARHTVRVTASVGVATLPAHAVDADDLVSKADRALYVAKQRGKDRVEVFVRD